MQGSAPAQLNLGTMYLEGRGIQANHAEALMWFQKSANAGYSPAQRELGTLYMDRKDRSKRYRYGLEMDQEGGRSGETSQLSLIWALSIRLM